MSLEILLAVTIIASILQAIAGFGFGLIVVPIFLLALGDASAVQLVIILTLMMSIFHAFFLHKHLNWPLLKQLSLGSLFGFPVGLMLFEWMPLHWLKLILALFIFAFAMQFLYATFCGLSQDVQYSKKQFTAIGFISGVMTSALAMPGPAVMMFLSRSDLAKDKIRAVMIIYMIFAYGGALIFHLFLTGIRPGVFEYSLKLLLLALLGVVVGQYLARFVSAYYFRLGILILLVLTSCFLLLNLAMEFFT